MDKKSKIVKTGLVAFLLIVGFSPVFVNAAYHGGSGGFNAIPSDMITLLRIDSPSNYSSYLEPMPLQTIYINVHVVNQIGAPVSDATVHTYPGQSQNYQWRGFTDANGIAYWPEPNVDQDTIYRIKAEKFTNGGYLTSTIYVTIRNRYLKVYASVNPVDEGNEFFGIVKDQDNQPVAMATVKFNGETKFTDVNGTTLTAFTAPWINVPSTASQVKGHEDFQIEASAPLRGYDDGKSTVTVCDTGYPKPHNVYGEVRDYNFVPLQNVKITTSKGNYVYTDENGDYSFEITPKEGGEWITITASLSGYSTQSVTKWVDGTDTDPIHVNFWFDQENGNQNVQGQQAQGQQQQYGYQQNYNLNI